MSHHIFCNWFDRPEDGCKMCERLRKYYPEDCTPDELVAKHFPSVIVREGTTEKRECTQK